MIETTELFPGVRLHFIRAPRFKQSLMTVQFLRPMCREESAKNALWSSVLLRGSRNYPDLRDITIRLDSLYGAGMGAMVRRAQMRSIPKGRNRKASTSAARSRAPHRVSRRRMTVKQITKAQIFKIPDKAPVTERVKAAPAFPV